MHDPGPYDDLVTSHADHIRTPVLQADGTQTDRVNLKRHSRDVEFHDISEQELSMLESGAGNNDKTFFGLFAGITFTCLVVNKTIKGLQPGPHAYFVDGFYFGFLFSFYLLYRSWKTRSLNKRIANGVRTRPTESGEGPPVTSDREKEPAGKLRQIIEILKSPKDS
jgi:hypothetical protein